MNQDEIDSVLELLEDAINTRDWSLIEEAYLYLEDFSTTEKKSKFCKEE